tara:strand:+ start:130 stop:738 length:609 start_codon:yes stop_codon:yes gene_type:complete
MTNIHSIFPTPIYKINIEEFITQEDLDYVKNIKQVTYGNIGNLTSRNTYVLNNKKFDSLNKILLTHINHYFKKIIDTSDKVTPYITQSWLNYTEVDQFHHKHAHSNSIISGVFYFNAIKENDSISFHKVVNDQISLTPKNYNLFNSLTWNFPVKTGDLILFPSNLGHSVDRKKNKNLRISLAFNVFIKGNLGEHTSLNELFI